MDKILNSVRKKIGKVYGVRFKDLRSNRNWGGTGYWSRHIKKICWVGAKVSGWDMYVTPIESDPAFHQKLNVDLTDEGTMNDTFEKTVWNLKEILFLLANAG